MTSARSTTAAIARERIALGVNLHRPGPHRLTEAGQFDAHQAADGFGRHVAHGDPGAAGGQDQAATLRGKRPDGVLNLG